MTHRYNAMNPGDALYMAARSYPGGIEALAARMGMKPGVLYKKLCTKVDSHHVNFVEASVIIDFLTEAGKHELVELVINSFCWRHDRVSFELPDQPASDDQLFEQVLVIMSNQGVLADGLRNALSDARISDSELYQFERDFQTCLLALVKLRQSIQDKHEDGKR
jgi:hypothetical protein